MTGVSSVPQGARYRPMMLSDAQQEPTLVRKDHSIVIEGAELKDLSTLLDHVERVCAETGVPASALFDIKLAVEEICANVIRHGYGDDVPGRIQLRVELGEAEVALEIRDFAPPFDAASVATPDLTSDLMHRQVGGLGWHLAREVMDELQHELDPSGGNRFKMVKRYSTVAGDSGKEG